MKLIFVAEIYFLDNHFPPHPHRLHPPVSPSVPISELVHVLPEDVAGPEGGDQVVELVLLAAAAASAILARLLLLPVEEVEAAAAVADVVGQALLALECAHANLERVSITLSELSEAPNESIRLIKNGPIS